MSANGRVLAFGISIPKPLWLVPMALVAIVVAFGIYTLATADVKRTSWRLAGPATGTDVQIGVYVGGCDQFERTSVREYDDVVVIDAYIRQGNRGGDVCPDILNSELKTVKLSAPLGSRALRGCNPESSVHKNEGSPNRDCVAETTINESPAMQELTRMLDGIVKASYDPSSRTYLSSVGIGIRESEDGQVYIQVQVHGVDLTEVGAKVPDEIEGYEVRLVN